MVRQDREKVGGAPGGETATVPPVLEETQRLINASRYSEAVRLAFLTAENDVIQAFGLRPPLQWTHREFITAGIRADMGYVADLLPRLYALYEPVRYGEMTDWRRDDLVSLLRRLYAEAPIRRLYDRVTTFGARPVAPPSDSGVHDE
ncbi:MAG: hypothetical protein WCA77_09045 [Thermoplasmata archaeon]